MTAEPEEAGSSSAFQEFFRTETATGVVLVSCALAALLAANSPWASQYHHVWMTPVRVGIGDRVMSLTLHQWINEGLMAVFFLLVGLEIKREVLAGELASLRRAALPVAGALGGMLVPAVIYLATARGGLDARGWAIPMATDIAFALGTLSLVAPRAPTGLKIFLAALAIVDDMGAVLVIAVFYTHEIAWRAGSMAGIVLALLITLNVLRIRRLAPYLILGAVLWLLTFASGVHATIAGIVLAFVVPTRTRINAAQYSASVRRLLDLFDSTETGDLLVLTSKGQQEALFGMERLGDSVTAPLLRLEHALHGLSAFVIMPLFALSNAGVTLAGSSGRHLTLAVLLGLAVGKPLGIMAGAFVAVRMRVAALPADVSWTMVHGCAWLGGIGFTMSLFIATLAFDGTGLLDSAKIGIVAGSALSGVVGMVLLRDRRVPGSER